MTVVRTGAGAAAGETFETFGVMVVVSSLRAFDVSSALPNLDEISTIFATSALSSSSHPHLESIMK